MELAERRKRVAGTSRGHEGSHFTQVGERVPTTRSLHRLEASVSSLESQRSLRVLVVNGSEVELGSDALSFRLHEGL